MEEDTTIIEVVTIATIVVATTHNMTIVGVITIMILVETTMIIAATTLMTIAIGEVSTVADVGVAATTIATDLTRVEEVEKVVVMPQRGFLVRNWTLLDCICLCRPNLRVFFLLLRFIHLGNMMPRKEEPMVSNVLLAQQIMTRLGDFSAMGEQDDLYGNVKALAQTFVAVGELCQSTSRLLCLHKRIRLCVC